MIIIALADIHGSLSYLPKIADELSKADLVLIAGDITDFGDWAQADRILAEIRRHNPKVLAVPGNCDRPDVNDYLTSEGMNLHDNLVNVDGISFVGLGGSLPCHGHTPNEMADGDFTTYLDTLEVQLLPNDGFVLVTHQPAADTAVDISDGEHIGSRAVRRFIEKNQPILAVSGHTHQPPGTDHIGQTTLITPGPFRNGKYAYIELTDRVESVEPRQVED